MVVIALAISQHLLRVAQFRHGEQWANICLPYLYGKHTGGWRLRLAVLGSVHEAGANNRRIGIGIQTVRVQPGEELVQTAERRALETMVETWRRFGLAGRVGRIAARQFLYSGLAKAATRL